MSTPAAAKHLIYPQRFAFLCNGGAVKRFHQVPTWEQQTIAAHSFGVAWFCYWLSEQQPSVNLLMAALAHDMAEQFTGDIPAPTKRELNIRGQVKNIEMRHLQEHEAFFTLTPDEEAILDCADCLEGLLFCCRELTMGNRNVLAAGENFLRYLKAYTIVNGEMARFLVHMEILWKVTKGEK